LWIPRGLQGAGRHGAPDRYACMYLAQEAVSAVAESLAPFRGTGDLAAELPSRCRLPLGLAQLELADDAVLVDLDDPRVLVAESLSPSTVATGRPGTSRSYAVELFERHRDVAGLRWWSSLETSWLNVTLFDRGLHAVNVHGVRPVSTTRSCSKLRRTSVCHSRAIAP
jgi:hypothetical protein